MAATNSTTNYDLPQWVATDKPQMADFNTAMADIDTNINLVQSDLDELKSDLAASVSLWSGAVASGTITLSENALKFAYLTIWTSNAANDSTFRSSIIISPRITAPAYYSICYATGQTYLRCNLSASGAGLVVLGLGHVDARVVAVFGEGRID